MQAFSNESMYTNCSHCDIMPINWNDIPHNSHIQYMEDDCNKNPITQEQIDAGIWEAWELGILIDAEEAKQPKPGSKARCGANIHAANARIPGAMPEAHIKHSGPAKPQMAENICGHISL